MLFGANTLIQALMEDYLMSTKRLDKKDSIKLTIYDVLIVSSIPLMILFLRMDLEGSILGVSYKFIGGFLTGLQCVLLTFYITSLGRAYKARTKSGSSN